MIAIEIEAALSGAEEEPRRTEGHGAVAAPIGQRNIKAAIEGRRAAGSADGVGAQHVAAKRPERLAALIPGHAVRQWRTRRWRALCPPDRKCGSSFRNLPSTLRRPRQCLTGLPMDAIYAHWCNPRREQRAAPCLPVDQRHRATRRRNQDLAAAVDRLAVVRGAKQRAQVGGDLGTVGGAPRPHLAVRGRRPFPERQNEDLIPSADDQFALLRRLSSHGDLTRQRHDHQPA